MKIKTFQRFSICYLFYIKCKHSGGSYPREGVDVSSLMATGQSPLIAFAIGSNVLLVAQSQFLNRLLNHVDPAVRSH